MITATTIAQNPDKPVAREILADAIVTISKAMRELSSRSRLNREAIVVLIQHSCGPTFSRKTINIVLDAIATLERDYVTPK